MPSPAHSEHVLFGGPADSDYSDGAASLAEFFYKRLAEQPESQALTDGLSGAHLSSQQLLRDGVHFASQLRRLGISSTARVTVCAENRLSGAICIFGTIFAGATLVPTNPTYTERELRHALKLARPAIVIASASSWPAVVRVVADLSYVQHVIALDAASVASSGVGCHAKVLTFDELMRATTEIAVSGFRWQPQTMGDKVALLLYSSGTTGLPKGVELTERNVMTAMSQHSKHPDAEVQRLTPEPILLTIGPWSHSFGCMSMLGTVAARRKLVFLAKFVDTDYLAAIQRYKINQTHVVPPLMVFLAKHPLVDRYDVSSLKYIACGGAPLTRELCEAVSKRIGVQIIRQGYGMTETTLAVTAQRETHCKEGSIGMLMHGTYGRVVDIETGRPLAAFERGELQFAGATIMRGYVGDSDATAATIDADGWLHTGDIGYYDADGEWFIVDRLKELIKYNGFQVPPAELEGILLQHPLIADAGVVGVADERAGELPLAFVVRRASAEGAKLTAQQVIDFVAERTSKAKRLHGGVRFVAVIPKNPSGKILRRELRDLLKSLPSKL